MNFILTVREHIPPVQQDDDDAAVNVGSVLVTNIDASKYGSKGRLVTQAKWLQLLISLNG